MSRCLGERQVTLGRRVALWFREYLSKSPGREDIRTRRKFSLFPEDRKRLVSLINGDG